MGGHGLGKWTKYYWIDIGRPVRALWLLLNTLLAILVLIVPVLTVLILHIFQRNVGAGEIAQEAQGQILIVAFGLDFDEEIELLVGFRVLDAIDALKVAGMFDQFGLVSPYYSSSWQGESYDALCQRVRRTFDG